MPLNIELPSPEKAPKINGMPVSAVAAAYETLSCVAIIPFVGTNIVLSTDAVANDRSIDENASSFFHLGQFCTS